MKRLLIVVLAVVAMLSLASASAVFGASKTISGVGTGTTGSIATISTSTFDVNFDGVPDTVTTSVAWCRHYGVLDGYISWNSTRTTLGTATGAPGFSRSTNIGTFWGKVGDSAPGTMTITNTGVRDPSFVAPLMSEFRQVVVEGSGSGGLEGVSGFGVGQGQSAPRPGATVTVPSGWSYGWLNYQFSFGPK